MPTKKPGRGVDKKGRSRKGGKFVRLSEPLVTSAAWRSLSGSSVRFYIELRRRFNGTNNGALHFTAEEANSTLGMGTNTFMNAQRQLEGKGFIRMTQRGGFYQRKATLWALTDEPVGTQPATHDFKNWADPKKSVIARTATSSLPKRQPGNGKAPPIIAETATIEPDSAEPSLPKRQPF